MAAFTEPANALQAAIAMHRQLHKLNDDLNLTERDRLLLKIGIDAGPCVSVTLNHSPDYFGTTVNTAARVQGTSYPGSIAITEPIVDASAQISNLQGCRWERRALPLKGLDTPVTIHYLFPNG